MHDHFVGGDWIQGQGKPLLSISPSTGEEVFRTRHASSLEVERAFSAAAKAFPNWVDHSLGERVEIARRFADIAHARQEEFGQAISAETGKPRWEASQEVDAVVRKIDLSIEAYRQRTGMKSEKSRNGRSDLSHAPHGVVVTLGPFNFPAHLPNGHIAPALIAGNCVVFKPSELSPLVGALMVEFWRKAGLPSGCLSLLQGDRTAAELILGRPELAGVFFTGSARTGIAIHQRFAGRPDVILALEMGGNNPLVVLNGTDPIAAARTIATSAFISAGQRCTCSRRLILVEDNVLAELIRVIEEIRVGSPDEIPEPFIGPLINSAAAQKVLQAQEELIERGGEILIKCRPSRKGIPFLQPGLLDVTSMLNPPDEEIFGPLLLLTRVTDFDAAILKANSTRYGLAAGLIGGRKEEFELFRRRVRAGIINWNRPTTGASSAAPFGGVGLSGNHRPSAFYAADYSAYPIATMQSEELIAPEYPGLP
jgi:succinylglutamic semialdehyde dehydrogenase